MIRPEKFEEKLVNLVESNEWCSLEYIINTLMERAKNDLLEPWIMTPTIQTVYQDDILVEYNRGVHFAYSFLYKLINFIIRRRKNTLKRQMSLRGFYAGFNVLIKRVKREVSEYHKRQTEIKSEKVKAKERKERGFAKATR